MADEKVSGAPEVTVEHTSSPIEKREVSIARFITCLLTDREQ